VDARECGGGEEAPEARRAVDRDAEARRREVLRGEGEVEQRALPERRRRQAALQPRRDLALRTRRRRQRRGLDVCAQCEIL
jgi:hypothetical protein